MEVAATPTVHMKTFEEGLGRIMFEDGSSEHERPFLGPLFEFLTLHPRFSIRRVPPCASFILEFLNRHYDCNEFLEKSGIAPRVDAQASSTRTGIGGWFPHLDRNGEADRWISPWFSLEISRETFPWVCERGNKPALLISTLEALAVLIALQLHGDDPGNGTTSVTLVPTFTDHRETARL